jgi:hypothetical protein
MAVALAPIPNQPVGNSHEWREFFFNIDQSLKEGLNVTIVTAKLTGGGVNGSMTFVNGILTAQTQAT